MLVVATRLVQQTLYLFGIVTGHTDTATNDTATILMSVGYQGMSGSQWFNTRGKFVGLTSRAHVGSLFGYSGIAWIKSSVKINEMLSSLCRKGVEV